MLIWRCLSRMRTAGSGRPVKQAWRLVLVLVLELELVLTMHMKIFTPVYHNL